MEVEILKEAVEYAQSRKTSQINGVRGAMRLRMQKSYRASWISLAICQHTGIAVSGRYSGGSSEMKDYRS
ncbi:hypothetical protein RG28_26955 (plasmid) [Escherichia coli]|nr:hypothetical protein RG28_26955 [Escherichia coli]